MFLLLLLLVYVATSLLGITGGKTSQWLDLHEPRVLSNEEMRVPNQNTYSDSITDADADDLNQRFEMPFRFRTEELLESHYLKHGSEFGDISKEEYLRRANDLITTKSVDVLTKYEEDGDKLFYLKSTNEFLVLSTDGYIRTYFKPDDGIDYYNRQ